MFLRLNVHNNESGSGRLGGGNCLGFIKKGISYGNDYGLK
jgi:hypothetical protein